MHQLRVIALFVIASAVAFGVLHFAGNVFGILGMLIAAGILYLLVTATGNFARSQRRSRKTDEL